MAALNLNDVSLCGRLTADVELRQTPRGQSVVQFDIAINRPRPADGSEQKADFIRCSAWDKTAEFIGKYFKKGDSIYLRGSLRTNKYKTSVGALVVSTEVVANEARFVDNKSQTTTAPMPSADNSAPPFDDYDVPF